jgi:hypothetical protein
MSRFVVGHLLELHFELGKFQLFGECGVGEVIVHVLRFHLHVEFEHAFEIGRFIERLGVGRWFATQVPG